MRLLVVEDSTRLRESLLIGLRGAGYAVDEAADGEQGLWLAQSHQYDVIILDRMLPLMDGLEVLRRLRLSKCNAHVLMLTARDRVEDKVDGLRCGADDYLVKPFAFDELLARIESLVRRHHGHKSPTISLGRIQIDVAARTVSRDGGRLDLSAREFAILEYLATRRGHIISRSQIEEHVWGREAELMSNVVDTVVYNLRKKLDTDEGGSLIHTRRGMGYEIVTEEEGK